MKTRCESVGRFFIPTFRLLVAKRLIKDYSFTQIDVSKKLGVTQAAISQYLYSKRGIKKLNQLERISEVNKTVNSLAKRIAEDDISEETVISELCRLCMKVSRKIKF